MTSRADRLSTTLLHPNNDDTHTLTLQTRSNHDHLLLLLDLGHVRALERRPKDPQGRERCVYGQNTKTVVAVRLDVCIVFR